MKPAQVRQVLAGAAAALALIAGFEGYRSVGYHDVGRPTDSNLDAVCYGHTLPNAAGKRFTEDQCTAFLAHDAVAHGLDIARCLPADLPTDTRGAFTSAAFNLGTAAFCRSSMSRKALAGDLRGACAALELYVYAGKNPDGSPRRFEGLARRRAAERALCERGLNS